MKVGVGVAGNQSMVGVGVRVWVGVAVGSKGAGGRRISQPALKTIRPMTKTTHPTCTFFAFKISLPIMRT
jgi:hypothetical protein